jgi:nucleoside-diphosphate-sugar epimerase
MTIAGESKRIALIGGGGFIGHNLALALKDRGHSVEIVDSLQVNNLITFATANRGSTHRDLYVRMLHQRLDMLHEAGIPLHVQDARDYHAITPFRASLLKSNRKLSFTSRP